ncbi:MAG: AI-2E family transporter [Planctomycetales bacterium]|nr:AI-2E family transporter [Planctomycetales bacterium]
MPETRDSRLLKGLDADELRFIRRLPWEKIAIWGLFLLALYALRYFFDIIFVTFVLSYIAYNVVEWVCRKVGREDPSGAVWRLTTVGVFLLLAGVIVGAVWVIIPRVAAQGRELAEKIAPGLWTARGESAHEGGVGEGSAPERVPPAEAGKGPGGAPAPKPVLDRAKVDRLFESVLSASLVRKFREDPAYRGGYEGAVDLVTKWANESLPSVTAPVVKALRGILTFVFHFLLAFIFAFLIVVGLPRVAEMARSLGESNLKRFYDEIAPGMIAFGNGMGKAFQAQTLIALCNTVLTFIGLQALDIPSSVVLSVIVFACSFIPVAGVFISTVPICLVALAERNALVMLYAIGLITVIHLIEAYVLNPRIMGSVMHIHPLVVLVILFLGEHLFGVWGLLLGVPTCHYVFTYFIQRARPGAHGTPAPAPALAAPAPPRP